MTFHFKLLEKSLGMILWLTNFIPVILDRTARLTIDPPSSLTRTTYLLFPHVLISQVSHAYTIQHKFWKSTQTYQQLHLEFSGYVIVYFERKVVFM